MSRSLEHEHADAVDRLARTAERANQGLAQNICAIPFVSPTPNEIKLAQRPKSSLVRECVSCNLRQMDLKCTECQQPTERVELETSSKPEFWEPKVWHCTFCTFENFQVENCAVCNLPRVLDDSNDLFESAHG